MGQVPLIHAELTIGRADYDDTADNSLVLAGVELRIPVYKGRNNTCSI